MDQLERPGVIDGEIRAVTDAQHGRALQFVVEQSHDMALALLVERGRRFVEKDPARFVQEEPREGDTLLLAERQLAIPPFLPIELGDEIAESLADRDRRRNPKPNGRETDLIPDKRCAGAPSSSIAPAVER